MTNFPTSLEEVTLTAEPETTRLRNYVEDEGMAGVLSGYERGEEFCGTNVFNSGLIPRILSGLDEATIVYPPFLAAPTSLQELMSAMMQCCTSIFICCRLVVHKTPYMDLKYMPVLDY